MATWKEMVAQQQAQLTAYGVLFEAMLAPMIARHPDASAFIEALRSVEQQAKSAKTPVLTYAETIARRLREAVDEHAKTLAQDPARTT
jgi:hypothetical protein